MNHDTITIYTKVLFLKYVDHTTIKQVVKVEIAVMVATSATPCERTRALTGNFADSLVRDRMRLG